MKSQPQNLEFRINPENIKKFSRNQTVNSFEILISDSSSNFTVSNWMDVFITLFSSHSRLFSAALSFA